MVVLQITQDDLGEALSTVKGINGFLKKKDIVINKVWNERDWFSGELVQIKTKQNLACQNSSV